MSFFADAYNMGLKSTCQLGILLELCQTGVPVPFKLLKGKVHLTPDGFTTAADSLERLGFAKRVSNPLDRRAYGFVATDAGRDAMAALISPSAIL